VPLQRTWTFAFFIQGLQRRMCCICSFLRWSYHHKRLLRLWNGVVLHLVSILVSTSFSHLAFLLLNLLSQSTFLLSHLHLNHRFFLLRASQQVVFKLLFFRGLLNLRPAKHFCGSDRGLLVHHSVGVAICRDYFRSRLFALATYFLRRSLIRRSFRLSPCWQV